MINQFIYQRLIYALIKNLTEHHDLKIEFARGSGFYVYRITVRENPNGFWETIKYLFSGKELRREITRELFEQHPRSLDQLLWDIEETFNISINENVRGILHETTTL